MQYSATSVIEARSRGVLDAPVPAPPRLRRATSSLGRQSFSEGGKPRHDGGGRGYGANNAYCAVSPSSIPRFNTARAASRCSVVMWLATMRMAVASTAASSVKPRIGITSGTKSNGRMK